MNEHKYKDKDHVNALNKMSASNVVFNQIIWHCFYEEQTNGDKSRANHEEILGGNECPPCIQLLCSWSNNVFSQRNSSHFTCVAVTRVCRTPVLSSLSLKTCDDCLAFTFICSLFFFNFGFLFCFCLEVVRLTPRGRCVNRFASARREMEHCEIGFDRKSF